MGFLLKFWILFSVCIAIKNLAEAKEYHIVHCFDGNKGVVMDEKYYVKQNANTMTCCNNAKIECRVDTSPDQNTGKIHNEYACVEEKKGQKMSDAMWQLEKCCRSHAKGWDTVMDDVDEAMIKEKCK